MKKSIKELVHIAIREKWIPIYKGECTVEPDCPLCEVLHCIDCPVYEVTGIIDCGGAEMGYYAWSESYDGFKKGNLEALKVLRFLIRLLPRREQKQYKEYLGDKK